MIRKYATLDVLDAQLGTQRRICTAHRREAHRVEFDYEPRPGFLYVRSRAISSRANENHDEFPAEELKKSWRTFIGRPVYVNHHNHDPSRARGVIIGAALHEDTNPDGTPDTWIEVLMEVDAHRYPKLAKRVLDGDIERTSMGVEVDYSTCSVCGNLAYTEAEYCSHLPTMKGRVVSTVGPDGRPREVLCTEICHGLRFFENSLLVEPPADPTAVTLGVDDRGLAGFQLVASKTAAGENLPQWTYTVTLPDGSKESRGTTNTYAFVLAVDRERETPSRGVTGWSALSWHSRRELAEQNSNQWRHVYPVMQIVPVDNPRPPEMTESTSPGKIVCPGSGKPLLKEPGGQVTYNSFQGYCQVCGMSGRYVKSQGGMGKHTLSPEKARQLGITASRRQATDTPFTRSDGSPITVEQIEGWDDEDDKAVDWLLELRRLQHEDGLSFEDALARVNAQYPTVSRKTAGYWGDWEDDLDDQGSSLWQVVNHRWESAAADVLRRRDPITLKPSSGHEVEIPLAAVEQELREQWSDAVGYPVSDTEWTMYLETGTGPFEDGSVVANRRTARRKVASHHHGYGEITVPDQIDTIGEECPVCGAAVPEGDRCGECGYVVSPEPFRDPDLSRAQELREQNDQPQPLGGEQPPGVGPPPFGGVTDDELAMEPGVSVDPSGSGDVPLFDDPTATADGLDLEAEDAALFDGPADLPGDPEAAPAGVGDPPAGATSATDVALFDGGDAVQTPSEPPQGVEGEPVRRIPTLPKSS